MKGILLSTLRLTSVQNTRLKQALKLRQRRGRKQQSRIIIDGMRAIHMALQAGVEIQELFVADGDFESAPEDVENLMTSCSGAGVQVCRLAANLMTRISYGDHRQQLVATAKRPSTKLDDLVLPNAPLIAVVERVQKPGNVGAMLRSADGAGVDAVILADGETDLFNPNVIRASLGTVFTKRVTEATAADVSDWLGQQDLVTFVARVDGADDYCDCDFTRGTAVVFGSESDGVSSVWLDQKWRGMRLPMQGHADSLNVSNTAAVIFYEAYRQRSRNR